MTGVSYDKRMPVSLKIKYIELPFARWLCIAYNAGLLVNGRRTGIARNGDTDANVGAR